MATPANKPNGVVIAYYGTAASCQKFILDLQDWAAAQRGPDKALWALAAQSGTVIDQSPMAACVKNGCYRGYE